MTTAIETTLTPAQIEEARKVIENQNQMAWEAQSRAVGVKLRQIAEAALPEVLAQPGVLSAKVVKEGYYFNAIGIWVTFARPSGGEIQGYLTWVLKGYHESCPVKLSTKVRKGYKQGYRTFKSVKSAVKGCREFNMYIADSVDSYMAGRK